jgi:hypothetical protein
MKISEVVNSSRLAAADRDDGGILLHDGRARNPIPRQESLTLKDH